MPATKLFAGQTRGGPRTVLGIAVFLVVLTMAVFARGIGNGFISFDDPRYVTENQRVTEGLSAAGWRWAWTTYHASNWHPLTWLSLQLDAQIHGLDPRIFHFTNALLHAFTAAYLFLALWRMTGAVWRSASVAALFALHPLHVESVAWISERKDVLSGLLAMLTLLAYAWYVKRPGLGRYACVLLAYALGLTAKPMLVTLPFVLLLLDYWPLARWQRSSTRDLRRQQTPWKRLLREKVPLLVLALPSCLVTWQTQRSGEAVMTLGRLSLGFRLENALISYCTYLWQTIWPTRLAAFYPLHRTTEPVAEAALAAAFLVAMTALALAQRRRHPYLLVGWLWYLGMLLPVIGLVQVGSQAHADRYTYLPLIGIFIAASWGAADLAEKFGIRRVVAVSAMTVLAVCAGLSWHQIAFWHDSTRLWEHALKVDPDNPLADTTLGALAAERGDLQNAVSHYEAALRSAPHLAPAHLDLALALVKLGKYQEAVDHYQSALRVGPDSAALRTALGAALARAGRLDDAAAEYQQALRLDARNHVAHFNLGLILQQRGDTRAAAAQYQQALRIKPDYENAAFALASIAWKMATSDRQPASNDAEAAVAFARTASAAFANREPQLLEVVAAAYAQAESFPQAVAVAEQALALTADPRQRAWAGRRLQLYRARQPCRDRSEGP